MTSPMTAIEFVYPLIFPNYIGYSQYRFLAVTQVVDGTKGIHAMIAKDIFENE